MKDLPIPIIVPQGCHIEITQPYGSLSNIAWYKQQGLNIPFHNGVDLVIRPDPTSSITYGSACFCPIPHAIRVKTTFSESFGSSGNGITIQSDPFDEDMVEKMIQLVFWHISDFTNSVSYSSNDIIAYIGNTGLVQPSPIPADPFQGAHLHLMLFEFQRSGTGWTLLNQDNGVNGAIDPMTRFNIDNIVFGPKDITKDAPAVKWGLSQMNITETWQKIVYALKQFMGLR